MSRVQSRRRGYLPSCMPEPETVSAIAKRPLRSTIVVLGMLLALAAASASAQQRMFKCKDDKGKTYYTQTPPVECQGKEMDEMSKQGTVVKKREAAMTPEQMAAREAEDKRKKEEELAAKEEKRKNQALLNTYSSEKDIEDGRQRALRQAAEATKETETRMAEAQKRAQSLASEKEFYLKKPMPKKLQDDIKNNEIDIKGLQDALTAKKKELGDINAKYDEDKRRYLELTGAKPKGPAASSGAASAKK